MRSLLEVVPNKWMKSHRMPINALFVRGEDTLLRNADRGAVQRKVMTEGRNALSVGLRGT